MIKEITWSKLQKEKQRKESKEKIKEILKVVGYWLGLTLLALVLAPFLWFFLVLLLSL